MGTVIIRALSTRIWGPHITDKGRRSCEAAFGRLLLFIFIERINGFFREDGRTADR